MVKIAAVLASLLLLSGCVASAQAAPVEAAPAAQVERPAIGRYSTPAEAVPATGLGAQNYVDTIRGLLANVPHEDQPDADLIQGGKDICADIDDGAVWSSMVVEMRQMDLDVTFYRAVVRSAVLSFCPENIDALTT